MKKDIEWLKEEIQKLPVKYYGFNMLKQREEFAVSKDDVLELIDQLDEPEVLSEEWVDENKVDYDNWMPAVPIVHLQNLLVPKQKLPVIPKFVAEWYENEGKYSSWWNWFYKWGRDESRTELESKTIRWMQDYNEERFVDMFLHGYVVEEEQKYYVSSKESAGFWFLSKNNDGEVVIGTSEDCFDADWESLKLTEQEIKDYDERYWPFAVKARSWKNNFH